MFDPGIQGHQSIRQRLLDRVQGHRLTGSLLFAGPDGIGKRRVAMELAQRELCFRRTACGVCEGCKPFRQDEVPVELPNLLRIAPEGKAGLIRIGAIREDDLVEGGVIRWAHQAPPPGCHRWIVVEDAHRLHGASANMLLKTLEEPPAGTHFLMITHRPEAMLQTIRSRCERIPFGALGEDEAWTVAAARGWLEADRGVWTALSAGTLRLLDPDECARARAQVDAWVALLGGTALSEVAEGLLPDKTSDRAQSEQMSRTLEVLLLVLGDLQRLREGRELRLAPWAEALALAARRRLDVKAGTEAAWDLQRNLARNPQAELGLRDVVLALQA